MHVLQDLKSKRLPSLALHPSLTWTEYLGLLTYTGMGGHPSNDLKEESIFLSVIFFVYFEISPMQLLLCCPDHLFCSHLQSSLSFRVM